MGCTATAQVIFSFGDSTYIPTPASHGYYVGHCDGAFIKSAYGADLFAKSKLRFP